MEADGEPRLETRMEIGYLQEFVVIGESSSLAEAAKRLSAVPSTLSRHLDSMESELGLKLVTRTTTSFKLTREGETFLDYSRGVVTAYSMALDKTLETKRMAPRAVSVGGHMRVMSVANLISATTSYLARQHEPILLHPYEVETYGSIASMSSNDPCLVASSGLVDLSLLIGDNLEKVDGFSYELVFCEPLSLAYPAKFASTYGDPVDLRDFQDFTFVLAPFYFSFMEQQVIACRQAGFDPQVRRKHFHSFGDMYAKRSNTEVILLGAHDAAHIAPPSLSGLVHARVANDGASVPVYAVWPYDRTDLAAPVVKAMKHVQGELEKLPDSWTTTAA